jgi:hypothetical protein
MFGLVCVFFGRFMDEIRGGGVFTKLLHIFTFARFTGRRVIDDFQVRKARAFLLICNQYEYQRKLDGG